MKHTRIKAESDENSQLSKEEITMRTRILKLFGLGAALVLLALAAGNNGQVGVAQTQGCTVTVQPGQSIQQAINNAAEGAVICLSAGTFQENIEIKKSLTLRGAGRERTILKRRDVKPSRDDRIIYIESNAAIQDVQVSGDDSIGLEIHGSVQVNLNNCMIADNEFGGLFISGSAQVNLNNCTVSRNGRRGSGSEDEGIIVFGSSPIVTEFRPAQVMLINSTVSDNKDGGIALFGTAQLSLFDSTVSGNESFGLFIDFFGGVPQAILTKSTIANNNGMGIFVVGATQLGLSDSIIKDNTDWGLAAYLKQCGFETARDGFTGQVIFEGKNTIEGNNKSGNQNGKGNPGNHPFKNLPDGQVCLP